MGYILVLSSDWINVINAIIFEVVLITVIFYLTADVCARLNYLSLADGSVQDLVVLSPPLLGGGVISTNRKRSILMIALRGLGIFLIFGTALTIDGETRDVKSTTRKLVRTAADVPSNTSKEQIESFIDLRSRCASMEKNTMVFGRLDDDKNCETDLRLLDGAIRIGFGLNQTAISFFSGCTHNQELVRLYEHGGGYYRFISTCQEGSRKGSVCCFRSLGSDGEIRHNACQGLFQLSESKWAVCEVFDERFSGPSISVNLNCHSGENLEQVQDRWLQAAIAYVDNPVIGLIRAVSVIGVENRVVEVFTKRDVTNVHPMWFLCLAVKLLLLVLLGALSIRLRMKGAKRVLNDDRALLALLRHKLDDWFGARSEDEEPTIYLHLQTADDGERRVWASTMPNYNPGSLSANEES